MYSPLFFLSLIQSKGKYNLYLSSKKNNKSSFMEFVIYTKIIICIEKKIQGWGSDIFSIDPDPAQLGKKIRIRLRIRTEMKKKIYLYFR